MIDGELIGYDFIDGDDLCDSEEPTCKHCGCEIDERDGSGYVDGELWCQACIDGAHETED